MATSPVFALATAGGLRRRLARRLFPDVTLSDGVMQVDKTGATARIDAGLLLTVFKWMRLFAVVWTLSLLRAPFVEAGPPVRFAPERPQRWYMVRMAMLWARMPLAGPGQQGLAFAFDDATWSPPVAGGAINGGCTDIAKGHVAQMFERAFGYTLAIDPVGHVGMAVEKSDINSLHDGRVVHCPVPPREGCAYQRLVDTFDGRHIHDLRTQVLDGRPLFVMRKSRRPADRFVSIANRKVALLDPDWVFSAPEIAAIGRFCRAMNLDWGTLDILRDRHDGRIYIVDANKTDVGPVLNLSMIDKLRAIARLGKAFRDYAEARLNAGSGASR